MGTPDDKRTGRIWHKVTMSVAKEDADAVRRAIQSYHCCGIESDDEGKDCERLDAYFDDAIEASDLQRHVEIIAELISAAGGRTLRLGTIEVVPEEDWSQEWRRNWKPVRVTEKLVVCPSWQKLPPSPGQTVICIYPQMAFGTGSHPTTQLCLRLLELCMPPNARVIDIGSGSGILAIAAAKLGARKVVAVEMDEAAAQNARENVRHNRTRSKIRIICRRFDRRVTGRFDLGICNMLAHEMEHLLPDMTRLLTGRELIVSGLTSESAPTIKREMLRQGWHFKKTLKEGEWLGFHACHRGTRPQPAEPAE